MFSSDREFVLRSRRTVQVCCGIAFALSAFMTMWLTAVPSYITANGGTFVQVHGLLSLLFMILPLAFTGLIFYHVLAHEVVDYESKRYLWLASLLFLAYCIVIGVYGVLYAPSMLVLILAAWVNSVRKGQEARASSTRSY